jgi:hypothetical protein
LTLIHVGTPRDDLDTRIFSRVHRIWFERGLPKSDFLFDNDLGMLFFPDVGMSEESRFLSNIRFAPVQVTTNSHPVSTFGSEIDYFLTGAASEEPPEQARRHYQEQLVLIPGIGTLPVMPAYVPEYRPMTEPLRIACAWGVLKYNNALLLTLKRIAESVRTPVVFRFLSTMSPKSNYHVPFQRDLESILGIERVEFYAASRMRDTWTAWQNVPWRWIPSHSEAIPASSTAWPWVYPSSPARVGSSTIWRGRYCWSVLAWASW